MQLGIYLERVDVIYRRIDDGFLDPLNGRCCQCPKPNRGEDTEKWMGSSAQFMAQ